MERKWDPRLTDAGVRLEAPAAVQYRLVEASWRSAAESGDKHHIFVRILDDRGTPLEGQRFRVTNGGARIEYTKAGGYDQFWGNFPMFAGGVYSVDIPNASSDQVTGARTGMPGNAYANTSIYLVFQRGVSVTPPGPPTPPPQVPPIPPPPPALDAAKKAQLLALLDKAQSEIDAARALLEGE